MGATRPPTATRSTRLLPARPRAASRTAHPRWEVAWRPGWARRQRLAACNRRQVEKRGDRRRTCRRPGRVPV